MRVLITGATGSMAYYLAEYIRSLDNGVPAGLSENLVVTSKSHKICGIGRKFELPSDARKLFDQYDQLDIYWQPTSRVTEYLKALKPDIIFHLAAMANVKESFNSPRRFISNNIEGTQNLFDGIAQAGIKPRIVLASTSEVYGNVPEARNPIVETEPFAPVNFYAATKCAQEHLAHAYSKVHDLEFVITRAFGYINPRRADLVATAFATQWARYDRNQVNTIYHGSLEPVRSFCDARDIAEAYWLAATKCEPGAYNIGSPMACSIGTLFSKLRADRPGSVVVFQKTELMRPTDIFCCVPNIDKFAAATGWTPKITLDESLKWLMECVEE